VSGERGCGIGRIEDGDGAIMCIALSDGDIELRLLNMLALGVFELPLNEFRFIGMLQEDGIGEGLCRLICEFCIIIGDGEGEVVMGIELGLNKLTGFCCAE